MQNANIIGWASLRRQAARKRAWRTISAIVGISMVINVSALGVFLNPGSALALSTDTGSVAPNQTVASNSVTTPDNGWVSDNLRALFDSSSDTVDYGFPDLAIPASATINGIAVTIEGQRTNPGSRNLTAALWNTSGSTPAAYTVVNSSKTATLSTSSTDNVSTLGGPADLWGKTWTVSDFADATFKLRVGATSGSQTASLDQVTIKVYYSYTPAPTTGTITIQKQFDTNADGTVDIDGSTANPVLADWDFTVDTTPSAPQTKTTPDTGNVSFTVQPGTYSVAETAYTTPTNLLNATCVDSQTKAPVGDPTDVNNRSIANIAVVAGQTVSCTFLNAVQTGNITIHKHVVPLNGPAIDDPAGWTWSIQDVTDPQNPGALLTGYAGGHTYVGTTTKDGVTQTDYEISESLANYPAPQWTASYDCLRNGQPITQGGSGTGPVLHGQLFGQDDDLTCTFTNTEHGANVTVIKNVDENSNGTIDAGESNVTTWAWDANGGSQNYATGSTHEVPIVNGQVALNEVHQANYHFTSVSCTENGNAMTGVTPGESVNFPARVGGNYVCTYTNTKNATTVSVDKQGPTTVTAGQNMTYTINWTVNGNTGATNAIITDVLPANTTFVSADNGGVNTNGTVTWNLGAKATGTSGTVSVTVAVSKPLANGTVITNTASFDTDQTDPVIDPASTTVSSVAQLSITKTNSVSTFVNPGATVTYTVVVTNAASATDTATTVDLTDTLPGGFTYSIGGGSTKTFHLGNIAPGASVTTTYATTVSAGQTTGTYKNTASAKGTNTVAVSATSSVDVHVPAVLGATTTPALTLTKTVNSATTNPGKTLTYTMVVKNTGDGDATNVVVSDTLPSGLTFVGGGTTKSWSYATLAHGSSQTIVAQVIVGSATKTGDYVNTASAKADGVSSVNASATTHVVVPKVLGATTSLPTTGPSTRDFIFFALGVILLSLGFASLNYFNRSKLEVVGGAKK